MPIVILIGSFEALAPNINVTLNNKKIVYLNQGIIHFNIEKCYNHYENHMV
ncbi:hypothetical protein MNB_SUP05-4-408 [hydrothermal vent metagenome]|uniref:Uncharacterized protein n=1 Tax=hydrothermal vent metagenome TaxID=652676 RepID=A0A1W1D811_9ZZZZ